MRKLLIALGLWAMGYGLLVAEQRIEPIPFGNMDEWIVRYLKESKILGGHTKTLYTLGATDTIRENGAYLAADNNPWGCSDTYAKCFGVETAMSGSVVPEPRGYGYCCRLRNILSRINIGGDIYAMVSLISSCYSLELCIQMFISFLFSFAFRFSSFHSYL